MGMLSHTSGRSSCEDMMSSSVGMFSSTGSPGASWTGMNHDSPGAKDMMKGKHRSRSSGSAGHGRDDAGWEMMVTRPPPEAMALGRGYGRGGSQPSRHPLNKFGEVTLTGNDLERIGDMTASTLRPSSGAIA